MDSQELAGCIVMLLRGLALTGAPLRLRRMARTRTRSEMTGDLTVDLVRVPVVVQGRREVGAEMCSTRTCTCGRVFLSSRLFLCVPGVRSAQGRERRGVRVRWMMVGMARCPACPPLSCQEEEEEEERVGGEEPVQGGRWLWKNHPKPPIPSFRTMSNTTMVMPRGQAGRRPPPPAPPLRPRWLETWPRRRDLAKREPGGREGWRRCLHPWDGATDGGGDGTAAGGGGSEKDHVGPEVGPTSAFSSCVPTGIHGPTWIFWANLTPVLSRWRPSRRV